MARKSSIQRSVDGAVVGTQQRLKLVFGWTAVMWALELVDLVLGGGLDRFGVVPRSIPGLKGILFAPFLHAGFGHLIANTVPFVLLGLLVTTRKKLDFYVVAVFSGLTAGLGAWIFGGANTVHVGASGVIFGFLGFLMGRGIWERSAQTIALSLVVTAAFGSMVWGVLPTVGAGISWQSHLFGFIGGALAARALGQGRRR